MQDERRLSVAVVGGGLVGSLCASFFAQRGHEVHLYEYREDIRETAQAQGRSINLAMSSRARSALRMVGLEDQMLRHGIPMSSRMIHRADGSLHSIPYDPRDKQCIYSVGRKYLNEVLLSAAEKYPNVSLHFNHKLVTANLEFGKMTFQHKSGPESVQQVEATADLIVGADGAFSSVRRLMMRLPMFDFSQTYIEHGYLELCIPPDKSDNFAMRANHLHIWPRGSFMMIALPNQDRSWTVTLFMPFRAFASLDSPLALQDFFRNHFADALPLIGEDRLVADFFARKPSPLVTVKCRPYHVADRAVIIGDAAHAMVPFYGQGMNAGFEDCLLLDSLMSECKGNLAEVLTEYSAIRNKDAVAICDLAVYNYVEMRDLVNRRSFLLRKKLDTALQWLAPNIWQPLYSSVTFSDMPYHQCIANKQWQDKVVGGCVAAAAVVGVAGAAAAAYLGLTSPDPLGFTAAELWTLPWITS